MSVMTDLYHGKVQRFKVTYGGKNYFANATSLDGARDAIRTRLIREGVRNESLASSETFKAASGVMPSLRY